MTPTRPTLRQATAENLDAVTVREIEWLRGVAANDARINVVQMGYPAKRLALLTELGILVPPADGSDVWTIKL